MNTEDIFNGLPTSGYDSISQPKAELNNIRPVSLQSIQERVQPRQVTTGNTRGEQTIRGLTRIVNTQGTTVMIMGYKPGAF